MLCTKLASRARQHLQPLLIIGRVARPLPSGPAWRTQRRHVSVAHPVLLTIDVLADNCVSQYSAPRSRTNARPPLALLELSASVIVMLPILSRLGPWANPRR